MNTSPTEPRMPPSPPRSKPIELIASCAFGLESIVRRELRALDIEASVQSPGRVHFGGGPEQLVASNLWLRCADRVLLRIAEFDAADFDALFDQTGAIQWGTHIPVDGKFTVNAKSIQSQLSSVPAIQRAVKRAISDALIRDHQAISLPETGADYDIEVAIRSDVATITIDTTGRSLHRRGYRTDISAAPLKETLAAALISLSYWRDGRPLADPFCGSGTIPIEAALIGRKIAPGINRCFAFENWQFDPQILADARRDAIAGQTTSLEQRLIGRDIDARILRAARDNAARAGVADDIHFEIGDVADFSSTRRFGCLISNPPYGRRLGAGTGTGTADAAGWIDKSNPGGAELDDDAAPDRGRRSNQSGSREANRNVSGAFVRNDPEIEQLSRTLPDVFRRLPTWSHYILTSVRGFENLLEKKADRRRKLYNGRIECTYYQYQGPKPVAEQSADQTLVHAVGAAAFGTLDAKSRHQAELFAARLRNRAKHLRRFPTRRGITCYRIYHRDVPEIPLVVDRYEDHLHIVEYERPHERDPATHANWLDLMADTAAETLDVPRGNVHLKSRLRQRGLTQHEKLDDSDAKIVVQEGGLKFLVNLTDYTDTGLFLDHRITRDMVRSQSGGKNVLNLFCYTGSFTVYAVDGGAAATTSVDLNPTYTRWTSKNLSINKQLGDQHRMVTGDVREFIANHPRQPTYDLVVLDPPTFSNSKRTEQDWDVGRHSADLIRDLLPLVSNGGVIFFSSNFRRLKFDPGDLPLSAAHEISKQTVPEDYRNKRIHRCWRLVK